MRLSLRWLKQYIHFEIAPQELIDTLTMGGLEVEDAIDLGMGSGKIVVGEILEAGPHPSADRLRLCKVNAGTGEPLSIVCGAPNAVAGLRSPCALEGAVLPNGARITKSNIRGEESQGMLCAPDELGLGADHAGILELPDSYKAGEPFDYILDIKVTPNRPDCLSVFGIAREVAALTGKKVFPPSPRFKETLNHIEGFVRLSVKARGECPRYTCRLIRGVKVGPSPLWMQRMLEACGLRPINNVVDATNYVLYELGHPLHAFDFDQMVGREIRVRTARSGEKLALLDGRELKLDLEDLVIADAERAVALAGVMGGSATAVSDGTANVLLESAYFDPATIRRASKRHGISTDSSYRFERGCDRQRLTLSLHRAAQLIQEIAGGEIAKGQLDVQATHVDAAPILLPIERVHKLLGIALSGSEIADALVNLDFEIRRSDKTSLLVAVPSHRVDISRDVDLIEEVARLHGYNRIPGTLPKIAPGSEAPDRAVQLARHAGVALAALGFFEAVNFSFIGAEEAKVLNLDPDRLPALHNPINSNQSMMRPALLPGLLTNLAYNQNQKAASIALFESGKIWFAGSRAGDPKGERLELAAVLAGPAPKFWSAAEREVDFFDLKGITEHLFDALGVGVVFEAMSDSPLLHPGRSARLIVDKKPAGVIGEIHPDLAEKFDLRGRVYTLIADLSYLASLSHLRSKTISPQARFPASERDIAVIVERDITSERLLITIRESAGSLLEHAAVLDLYEGEHIPAGKRSLAFRLRLRSAQDTLTEEAITAVMERTIAQLEREHGAKLRA